MHKYEKRDVARFTESPAMMCVHQCMARDWQQCCCRATWATASCTAPPEPGPSSLNDSELFYVMARLHPGAMMRSRVTLCPCMLQSYMDMASQGLRPSLEDEPGLTSLPSVSKGLSELGDGP